MRDGSGRTVVVTSHGRPVARLVPVREEDRLVGAARAALFRRLRAATAKAVPRWTREDLYED